MWFSHGECQRDTAHKAVPGRIRGVWSDGRLLFLNTGNCPKSGKAQGKIITAVARELLGFIWAIGTRAETIVRQRTAA